MNPTPESISILWAGEWSLWQTLLVALTSALLAFWMYRTETKKGTSGPLRWVLPTLRCLALIALVLTFAGPVLQLQREEGNRGKITVFLDSSDSMNLKDKHYSPGKKILLAREHGFLPEESNLVDYRIITASHQMKKVADLLRKLGDEEPKNENNSIVRKELSSTLEILTDIQSTFSKFTKENVLLEEIWFNLEGINWREPAILKKMNSDKPDQKNYLSKLETPINLGDRYIRKISAYLTPPEDGEYIFWLKSDDSSVLQITQPEAKNQRILAEVKSATGNSWNTAVKSEKIYLQKSTVYPIEILHKEGSGDDFCAVGWSRPSGEDEKPIAGQFFSAPDRSQNVPFAPGLPNEIRNKFSSILRPDLQNASPDFEDLSLEAMKISASLEVAFNNYARSLMDQNLVALNQAISDFEKFSRIERATRLLSHPQNGILKEFEDTHLLEIRNLSANATEILWNNFSEPNAFAIKVKPEAPQTNLTNGLLTSLRVDQQEEEGTQTRGAAVLITDGGHNQGGSPLEAAKLLSIQNLPIYTIGLGSNQKPPDLALIKTTTPDSVYQEDRIRGTLTLKDNLYPGTPYKIKITDTTNKQVWEKSLVGMERGISQVDFDFPVKEIVERILSQIPESEKKAFRTIPLTFKLSVDPIEEEAETKNNEVTFSIDASRRKNQLLLIDSRPRWETRYLNNLFDRDERWEVSCVWGKPESGGRKLPRGDESNEFPISKKALLEFDLLIFGEIEPDEFSKEEQNWIVDFVTQRAGGILFIDGPRQKLRTFTGKESTPIANLLPVIWKTEGSSLVSPRAFVRPKEGNQLSALTLDPIKERNEDVWKHLPLPAWVSPTEALPGTEVFLEVATNDNNQSANTLVPVLAGRLIGAGKSFYLGFDESWRWRYEVADLYHQRFWNQLLSIVMEKPFALNQEQLSMDAGGSIHDPGKMIPLRVRLRDGQGNAPPPEYADADALIWQDQEVVATVPLQGMESTNGLFAGEVFGLEPGDYQMSVRAPDILDEMEFAEQKLPLKVKSVTNEERNFLTCNESLLTEMADLSGGVYFNEENFRHLKEVLRPISSGRIIITEIILWQSFGWLIFVVSLLALEMFLRKRAGML